MFESFSKFLGRSPKWYRKSKNVGFSEFSDSYAKKKIQAKIRTFLKILFLIFWKKLKTFSNFFVTKIKFRPRPIFRFWFNQNRTTRKYFLRGCTTAGGGLWPGDEKISENLPWTMPWYCN